MKVLQINAVYGHGSTGNIAKEILLQVKKIGGEVYVACPEKPSRCFEVEDYIRIGNGLDHRIHALYSRFFGKQGYASKNATRNLIKQIDRIKPDIIHLHNLHNNYVNIKVLFEFIERKKIKTVITLHDCWFMTGKCCHFLYDGCYKWKTKCETCIRQRKEIPSYFFDASEKMYNDKKLLVGENPYIYVVGCSKWITEVAKQSLLKERVFGTIYNGVDLSVFYPRKNSIRQALQIQDKYVILGMANKWLSEENIETYQYIMDNLTEDICICLIGCSEKEIKTLPRQIVGVGYIKEQDLLAQYYSMADLFVNVTKVDSLPTVNIEAIACGTPVVTYDSGGSSEVINEDVGTTIAYGDASALLEAINSYKIRDRKLNSKLCVKYAKAKFDKNECFKKYVDLYQQILNDEV